MQALILTGSLILAGVGAAQQGNAILFECARLIVGDGSAAIENSAFLVENNKFSRIGKKGDIRPPAGAARVDLTGKTVMPALIDAHTHLGWEIVKTGQMGADSYTRANLIDHLQRYVYYGIAAAQSMGIDPVRDAFLSPGGILRGHLSNEYPQALEDLRSATRS